LELSSPVEAASYMGMGYVPWIVIGCSVLSIIWALVNVHLIRRVKKTDIFIKVHLLNEKEKEEIQESGKKMPPQS